MCSSNKDLCLVFGFSKAASWCPCGLPLSARKSAASSRLIFPHAHEQDVAIKLKIFIDDIIRGLLNHVEKKDLLGGVATFFLNSDVHIDDYFYFNIMSSSTAQKVDACSTTCREVWMRDGEGSITAFKMSIHCRHMTHMWADDCQVATFGRNGTLDDLMRKRFGLRFCPFSDISMCPLVWLLDQLL